MPKRNQKKLNFKFSFLNLLSKLFFSIGLLLIGVSFSWDIYQRSLPVFFNYAPKENSIVTVGTKSEIPKVLLIPQILVNLEIEEAQIQGNYWPVSESGVSYLKTSSKIGESANLVLYGHNREKLLKKLPQIKKGAEIYLTSSEGKIYKYEVAETLIVKPSDVWILDKGDKEVLTIYTCTGFLDSKRFVVIAKPLL